MKKVRWTFLAAAFVLFCCVWSAARPEAQAAAAQPDAVPMYRLYFPDTHEHFYTQDKNELRILTYDRGWVYEGIGWYAPQDGIPVYRLFNPNTTDHHYTMDRHEYDVLGAAGWEQEGIGWFSDPNEGVPMYRLFCDKLQTGTHHYTRDANESNTLIAQGAWTGEGVGWYGVNTAPGCGPQKSRQELLAFFVERTGKEVIHLEYRDFDGDGRDEMFVVSRDGKDQPHEIWYVSCDAGRCEPVYYDNGGQNADYAVLTVIPADKGFHLVMNTGTEMGTASFYTILELKDDAVMYKAVHRPGNVDLTLAGDIILVVEDYDRMLDASGILVGHTWKETYLFCHDGRYGEYGASTITAQDFYACEGAEKALEEISARVTPPDDPETLNVTGVDFQFWKRSNGYMHVSVEKRFIDGSVEYMYFTLVCADRTIESVFSDATYGILKDHFSDLDNIVY